MGNLNKVMLIGRLTRDPEIKEFNNGGKVANIGFAVNNRKKDPQTGEWGEVPVWVDLKAFDRQSGRKLADLAEKYLHKGQLLYVEGHLHLDEWEGKDDGKKRSKMVVIVDDIQFVEKRGDGPAGGGGGGSTAPSKSSKPPGRDLDDLGEVPF